jgi:UDP-3-O-[3-hydroxymyristoyl] glucosamine N-acyltransferase
MTVDEMAKRLGGALEGDGTVVLSGVASLEEAGADQLTFLSSPRYEKLVATTGAAAIVVNDSWEGTAPCPMIRVANADAAFAVAAQSLAPPPPTQPVGVHSTAVVADGVTLGQDVSIGACCVVESGVCIGDGTVLWPGCYVGHDVVMGSACVLHANVSVREGVSMGDRVILHNGCAVGSEGIGYITTEAGWQKIPQVGRVEIGDDVEIGANTCIDRARFGVTRIGNGVKLDNLVQVAHNCEIGDHCAFAGQSGMAGTTKVGERVMMGGQAGMGGHVEVGDGAIVAGRAGVSKDVPPGMFVSGYPAMPHNKARKIHAMTMRLPEMRKQLKELERRIAELEGGQG